MRGLINNRSLSLLLGSMIIVLLFSSAASAAVAVDSSGLVNAWTVNSKIAYSSALLGTGLSGPDNYMWSIISGTLPPGLDTNTTGSKSETYTISGTPTAVGVTDIMIRTENDNDPADSVEYTIRITINSALDVSQSTLRSWTVTHPGYSDAVVVTGGTGTLTWAAPSWLLTGLALASGTGLITGTPGMTANTYNQQFTITDQGGDTLLKTLQVVFYDPPSIQNTSLPRWTLNHPGYSTTLTVATPVFSELVWSLVSGNLPTNQNLVSVLDDGIISGTPTASGTFAFRVAATDSAGAADSADLTITIEPVVSINPAVTPPEWTINTTNYGNNTFVFSGSGGVQSPSLIWSRIAGDPLPTGLSLNANTGAITGNPAPTNPATFTFTIQAIDSAGATATNVFSIDINQAVSVTTGSNLVDAVLGQAYNQLLDAVPGTGTLTWSTVDATLGNHNLVLSPTGTPNQAVIFAQDAQGALNPGPVSFNLKVSDQGGDTVTTTFNIRVDGPPAFNNDPMTFGPFAEGEAVDSQIQVTEPNSDGVVFSPFSGDLIPDGLTLGTDGRISGVVGFEAAGNYNFRVIACDDVGTILCDTAAIIMTIINTNRAPVLADADTLRFDTIQEGASLTALIATDPDLGDSLIFQTGTCNLPAGISLSSDGSFTGAAAFGTAGDYQCEVIVSDTSSTDQKSDTAVINITVQPDDEPPATDAPASLSGSGVISVPINDAGAGVDSVKLLWRRGDALASAADNQILMTLSGGNYQATVPLIQADTAGLEVRFAMVDKAQPPNADTSNWESLPVGFTTGKFTQTATQWLGSVDSLWHLVTFPGDLNDRQVRLILDSLAGLGRSRGADNDSWRLVAYDPTVGNEAAGFKVLTSEDQANLIQPGIGYWFRSIRKDFDLSLPAGSTVVTVPTQTLTLDSGWNLIGNPHFFPITVHIDSLALDGISQLLGAFPTGPGSSSWSRVLFAGTSVATLDPWKGYAAFCDGPTCTVNLDPHYVPPSGGSPGGKQGWNITVALSDRENKLGAVTIGLDSNADDGQDLHDIRSFMLFGGQPKIAVSDQHNGQFLRDIRARELLQEWELAISVSNATGLTLAWESPQLPDSRTLLVLRDVVTGGIIDMTSKSNYSIPNPAQMPAGRFLIYYGQKSDVDQATAQAESTLPEDFVLYQNYPNPFNPTTNFAFDLPHSGQVTLEVYNILGKRVAVVVDGHRAAGSHQVEWDGQDSRGNRIASGVYFARLKAGDFETSIKMALIK